MEAEIEQLCYNYCYRNTAPYKPDVSLYDGSKFQRRQRLG